MSNSNLKKNICFSQSPNLSKRNRAGNLRQVYFSPPKQAELPYTKVKLSDSLSKFPKNITKIGKFSTKNLNMNKSSYLSQSKDHFESRSYVDLEDYNVGIESVLKNKLAKEQNFLKKLEIVTATFEKLAHLNRNFSIFHSVISEFLRQVKDKLILVAEEEEKIKECEQRVQESEGKVKELSEKCEKIEEDLRKVFDENKELRGKLENLKGDEKVFRTKCKKQSILLTKLQGAGYPVEKFYELNFKPGSKSKSINNIPKLDSDEVKRPSSIPLKRDAVVPKLKFSQNEGSEGYQDEFMAKFNEFSESWRKQIMKDHHFK